MRTNVHSFCDSQTEREGRGVGRLQIKKAACILGGRKFACVAFRSFLRVALIVGTMLLLAQRKPLNAMLEICQLVEAASTR